MLRRLHWLILRRLPGPFFAWLGILMFLLLMQFLIRWLPEIAGKGIPVLVILELIAYNLAYMVVLAVPMSVLLAALMAFGGLAESEYYTVIKSTGIAFEQIAWPALLASLVVGGGLLYFNTFMLPEANYRARQLWEDIRNKRPGFELQPGVFYDGVDDYSILVQERPSGTNRLLNVTIYDYTRGRDEQAVIKAERGRITSKASGARMTLTLFDGEMHRRLRPRGADADSRYEQLRFDRHVLHFDLSDAVFRRSESDETGRSTRTTPIFGLLQIEDSLQADIRARHQELETEVRSKLLPAQNYVDALPPDSSWLQSPDTRSGRHLLGLANLDRETAKTVLGTATSGARALQSTIDDTRRDTKWKAERLRSYRVEIHKKFSIAVACFIFMLIGAPLGLALRRGGLGTIGVIALGIFMFYWITLVQGEKLSERGRFPPWIGMWIANLVMSIGSVWLLLYIVLDLAATPPLRRRIWDWIFPRTD
ncbi:MAG: YjgP/YjgQ family permease [Bacteroidetes bacterium SW_9_63_38]|nr:MAG: YjgP/YjgQ family permease [Bacteroidetes bacterium SW_9_63_38]